MPAEFDSDTWRELSSLLDEAFGLPKGARDAWLADIASRDPSLCEHLVRLLEADASAESSDFLGALPTGDSVEARAASSDVDLGRAAGDQVGPYLLVRELGRGGMGAVWLAERADGTFKRSVALKLPHPGHQDRAFRERFDRERDILAGLTHPNIARLYDAGIVAGGRPFLALEYVDGDPIVDYCNGRDLDLRPRIELFLQVLDAVQYAHRNLVVHRDLKPSNVLVNDDGAAMLLDFGIAKLLESADAASEAGAITELSGRPMTPNYASPEQVAGGALTTSSDVYSLGVMLFELLTGRLPYRLARGSRLELQAAITSGAVVPPSRAAEGRDAPPPGLPERKRLARELRGDLDAILVKALEKDPARRYASADAFGQDLNRFLHGEAVEARPYSTLHRARKFVRRHRLGVAVAAAVILAILGSLAFAVSAMRIARRERDRAGRVSSFLISLFKVSDPSEARGKSVTAREILDRGVAKIDQELTDEPLVQADLLNTMGEVYRSLGLFESAQPLLVKSLALRRRLVGSDDFETMESINSVASLLEDQGKLEDAEALFREALERRRRVLGNRHRDTLNAMNNLALVLQQRGKFRDAEPLFRESLDGKRLTLSADDPDLLAPINNLALLLRDEGKLTEAEPYAREVVEKARTLIGEDDPHTLTALGNLGLLLQDEGRLAEAEPYFRQALERRRRVLGADHPQTLHASFNLGECLRDQGRLADAEGYLRDSLDGFRRVLGADHPRTWMALNGMGLLHQHRGELREAERCFRESLDGRRRKLGPDHLDTIDAGRNLGALLEKEGRLEEAEDLDREAVERSRRTLGEENPLTLGALATLGGLYTTEGRAEEAEPLLAGAIASARKALPARRRVLGRTLLEYGRCLAALHRFPEAESALLESLAILTSADTVNVRSVATSLASLYERWGKSAAAADWRERAESLRAAAPPAEAPAAGLGRDR